LELRNKRYALDLECESADARKTAVAPPRRRPASAALLAVELPLHPA